MSTIKYRPRFKKNTFEQEAWQNNQLVCGIDEVGRGCLAGPVVCAAAILFEQVNHPLLKDSKLLNIQELEKAYRWLIPRCWFSYGIISNRAIDMHNIYYATLRVMKRSLMQLFTHCPQLPSTILVDAMPVSLANTSFEHINVYYFAQGERKSSSIAAASIIAKVTRDRLMIHFDRLFPAYKLATHKGYSTKMHRKMVCENGPSLIHRTQFVSNKWWLHPKTDQLSLFDTSEL